MQKLVLSSILTLIFFVTAEAKSPQQSTYAVSVERIFSARPRSLSYRYLVQILCQPPGENIITVPAKSAQFAWRMGTESGMSYTDTNGKAEFTQTAYNGNLVETLEIEFQGQKMYFTAAKGMQQVQTPGPCR